MVIIQVERMMLIFSYSIYFIQFYYLNHQFRLIYLNLLYNELFHPILIGKKFQFINKKFAY